MRGFVRVIGAAVVIAVVASACGDDKIRPTLLAPAPATGALISALDNTFSTGATATVGTEVKFVNNGRNDHNIVVSGGPDTAWGVGKAAFGPGAEYLHTFTEPGTYSYFCSIHGTLKAGMTGTITVTGPNGEVATETTVAVATTVAVVGGSTVPPGPLADADGVIDVPQEIDSIQGAVDIAKPGDLVLVAPGIYHEAVNVTTDGLTIRGVDRNKVVLDGEFKGDNGVRILGAKGVTVENMTAMNYTANGFFWTGVTGYHGSYLTTYRTGDYGVYVFDSTQGQLDHIYAAGSPDAGVYIGECYPCDALMTKVVSEHNGLGYSGTNSGGNLTIVDSIFHNNRAGIVPNTGSYELCYPERETTIVGNVVYSNNQPDTPAIDVALLAMGNGILIAGGVKNVIERNLVYDHDKSGIGLVPFLENDPNDAAPSPSDWSTPCAEFRKKTPVKPNGPILWDSQQTRVVGNVLSDNRQADLLVASAGADVSTLGHCFSSNTFVTSAPKSIEKLAPCDGGTGSGDWKDGEYDILPWLTETHPPSIDYVKAVLPALKDQENMPDATTAPARTTDGLPEKIDIAAIKVPSKPA